MADRRTVSMGHVTIGTACGTLATTRILTVTETMNHTDDETARRH
jgi:hypothetical protein